jgi:predicted DNA-binding transcriptional regulator YafY
MARNIKKLKLKVGIRPKEVEQGEKDKFVKKQKSKARKSRKNKKKFKEMVGIRSKRLVIRESAAGRKYMNLKYKKITTGEIKTYKVAPYSFRFRKRPTGQRYKALYAYDFKDKHIKSFYIKQIKSVSRTNSSFKPRWKIEIIF